MVGALFVYVLVYEISKSQFHLPNGPMLQPDLAYAILLGTALIPALLTKPLIRQTLKTNSNANPSLFRRALINNANPFPYAAGRFSPSVQKLITVTLLSSGLAHSPGIVGFMLSFITQASGFLYLGFVLSLALTILQYPRFRQWEEWAESMAE